MGHIHNEKGALTISGSTFTGGSGIGDGGAVRNWGTLKISDSVFENNYAHHGGAIYSLGNCEIKNSRIINNTARNIGGGISNNGIITNSMVVTDCEIYENTAGEWADDTETTVPSTGGAEDTPPVIQDDIERAPSIPDSTEPHIPPK